MVYLLEACRNNLRAVYGSTLRSQEISIYLYFVLSFPLLKRISL